MVVGGKEELKSDGWRQNLAVPEMAAPATRSMQTDPKDFDSQHDGHCVDAQTRTHYYLGAAEKNT